MGELFYRSAALKRELVDPDKRSAPVVFSSETPVMRRWFGAEILLHGRKNVDLSRLKAVGAALMNHDPRVIVGPLSKIKLDTEAREARAVVEFDDDEDGNKALNKVKSGSLRGVSVGYEVLKYREIADGEEWTDEDSGQTFNGPAYIATKWQPVEISLTPIPADPTSQIGREATRSLDGIEIERTTKKEEGNKMEEKDVRKIVDDAIGKLDIPKAEDIAAAVREQMQEENRPHMKVTQEELQDLLGRAGAISIDFKSRMVDMALEGKPLVELERAISDEVMKNTDAEDNPGNDPQHEREDTFEKVDDDEFATSIRSLSDATII